MSVWSFGAAINTLPHPLFKKFLPYTSSWHDCLLPVAVIFIFGRLSITDKSDFFFKSLEGICHFTTINKVFKETLITVWSFKPGDRIKGCVTNSTPLPLCAHTHTHTHRQ